MSRLNDLLRQVGLNNEALAADLQREVAALADRRSFGLNFERHVPEAVELPGRPIRRGDKVRCLPERGQQPTMENEKLYRVTNIYTEDGERWSNIVALDDPEDEWSVLVGELVVVAEFRDPIYPGLISTGKVEQGGDKPFHTVINAENYHALQALLFTHRGKVDCIYIDPPYNTGNEGWIYNDKYVADDDHYKHSKWLAFLERRLELAKELLKPTGVIVVAIGDEEHHRLRLLMDQIFDEQNFISDVVWQGGRKNDSRYVSNGADYMLIYARDESALQAAGVRWREQKPGLELMLAAGERAWAEAAGDPTLATQLFRKEIRAFKNSVEPAVFRYDQIDDAGRIFQADNLGSPTPRPNLRYEVLHPVTRTPVKMPPNGWRYDEAVMARLIARDGVVFGPDHATTPRMKSFLSNQETRVASSSFELSRMPGSKYLERVLGDRRFPNPKDHSVLMRWLRMIVPQDGIVLDFFGGSGSTAEAVMRLNEEDSGTRCAILVTNNEIAAGDFRKLRQSGLRPRDAGWEAFGVHEYVTRPRLSTIATGVRTDGTTFSDGLSQNLEFFTLTYEAPLRVASHRDFERIAPLLWMRAGSRGRRIDDVTQGWDVAEAYGVLADLDQVDVFVKSVMEQDRLDLAFIVTDEDRLFASVVRELPDHVEPVRLYEAYLRNFEIESGRGAR